MSFNNDFNHGVWGYISNYYNYNKSSAVDMVTSTINYFIEIYGLTEDAKKSILNCLDGKIEKKDIEKIFNYLKNTEV